MVVVNPPPLHPLHPLPVLPFMLVIHFSLPPSIPVGVTCEIPSSLNCGGCGGRIDGFKVDREPLPAATPED